MREKQLDVRLTTGVAESSVLIQARSFHQLMSRELASPSPILSLNPISMWAAPRLSQLHIMTHYDAFHHNY